MAVIIGGSGEVSGLSPGAWNGSLGRKNLVGMTYTQSLGVQGTLVTGIADSGTTTTRSYTLSNWVVMTSDIVAVIVRSRYIHNGSTNHGYFTAKLYQDGYSSNYVSYDSQHYDWYYNSTNEIIYVPWFNSTQHVLKIECLSSYNTSSSNTYSFWLEGVVKQSFK